MCAICPPSTCLSTLTLCCCLSIFTLCCCLSTLTLSVHPSLCCYMSILTLYCCLSTLTQFCLSILLVYKKRKDQKTHYWTDERSNRVTHCCSTEPALLASTWLPCSPLLQPLPTSCHFSEGLFGDVGIARSAEVTFPFPGHSLCLGSCSCMKLFFMGRQIIKNIKTQPQESSGEI